MSSADPRKSKIFVVHGRNATARDGMFSFLRALGLQPIEWDQAIQLTGTGSPYIGEILNEALNDAQAIVVLMTPDEIAYLRSEYANGDNDPEAQPAAQARPNVLFEAGMAMGRNSERTVFVELGEVRLFTDVIGRHAVRIDNSVPKRKALALRLQTAGCAVDLSGDAWMQEGDFTPPAPAGGGLPLGKRVPTSSSVNRARFDLIYHDRVGGSSGRLQIINRGTEDAFDLDLTLPAEVNGFHVIGDELPLAKLPAGKSANLIAFRTMGSGKNHFDIRITARTIDGTSIEEDVFVSLSG